MHSCLAILIGCTISIWPASALAQIYAWRDADGTLVLSDRTIDAPTDVYVVTDAPGYRTTRRRADRRDAPYEDLVLEHAARQGLRPALVRAVIQVESGFDPNARSPKGAMGLMQLMPTTAAELGVRDAFDPEQNIRGGTTYLRRLLDRFGSEQLALAAYNAGAGAVDKYEGHVPPYRETRDYVKRVGSAAGGEPAVHLAVSAGVIYKSIQIVGDRAVPRYSSEKPASGTYEIMKP